MSNDMEKEVVTAIAKQNGSLSSFTAAEVRQNVNLIQHVMKEVMQPNVHFGTVPGCGDKPTLLKAGAEKLLVTFRIAADPIVEDLSGEDERRYRVTTRGIHIQTGAFVGAGVGECSTAEDKYAWRGAVSEAEFEATDETRRRIKYTRNGQIKQVRTNPADQANTVLKMAKKRSLVDLALSATAASDIFTQDIEEIDRELIEPEKKQYPRKAQMQNATELKGDTYTIRNVETKTGTGARGPWTLYKIHTGEGLTVSTFNSDYGKLAESLQGTGETVVIEHRAGQRGGQDLISLSTTSPAHIGEDEMPFK